MHGVTRTEPLASRFKEALEEARMSVDALAERTKVARSTLRFLLGEPVVTDLPARVYLRGHLLLAAREIRMDEAEAARLFDETYPRADDTPPPERSPFTPGTVAMVAGLAGVGILAVILSFVGG